MFLSQQSIRPLPRSLWLFLPLLLTTANAQSIHGFVYLDSDFNGVLSEGFLDSSGTVVHELKNGVVNVRIEVKQCGSIEGESITQGLTGWLSNSIVIPGNSNVHSMAGYYKIDVGSNVNNKRRDKLLQNGRTGCLITNLDVDAINSESHIDGDTPNTVGDAGCYLVVSSPKDYEITTTFPMHHSHGFYGRKNASSQELNSTVDDIFSWIPYKDLGPFTINRGNDVTVINRGYQTRTAECFGFNKDNGEWYVWTDESLTFGDEITEAEENDRDLEARSGGVIQIDIPNSRLYGYDGYLTQTSYNFEGMLSISPVGMAKTLWPLPLRVKSNVYLGLKFSQNGPLKGRFQFQPISENYALAASKWRHRGETNTEVKSSNLFSSAGANAKNEYVMNNVDGILTDVSNLEDVVRSFLRDVVLEASGDNGLERMLTSLDVAILEQWSMVKITDLETSSNKTRRLRGLSAAVISDNVFPPCHLRGSDINYHRILQSMPTPHTVFYLRVYGTYDIRTTSEVASIIQTIEDFGIFVSSTINRKRDDLLRNIRARTGFDGPKCYHPPVATNGADAQAELQSSYSVTSIGIGSPRAFACDDLLPLYYYQLSEMVSRVDASNKTDLSGNMHLPKALEALKEEGAFYGPIHVQERERYSGSLSLIYVPLSVFFCLLVAVTGIGWVMYERRRRAIMRKRKQILKERRAMKRSSTKDAGINAFDNSHNSKVEASAFSSDDGIDAFPSDGSSKLGRRFDGSQKTLRKTPDLDEVHFSSLGLHVSHKSGLNHSTSSIPVDHGTFKTSPTEIFEVVLAGNDDAKHMTIVVEQSPNNDATTFSRKGFVKALRSFHKSTTQMLLGEVDISDSGNSSSDLDSDRKNDKKMVKSPVSPNATILHELSPNPKRKMLNTAMINVRSSLIRSKNQDPKMNDEGDQEGTRSRTTHNKTVPSGVEVNEPRSLLTEKSVHNVDSSNSSDNSSSPESSNEICLASTNMCDGASKKRAICDDQHSPTVTSPTQRLSKHVNSNNDDSSSSSSSNGSSDCDDSSSESSSGVIKMKNKNKTNSESELSKNRHQNYCRRKGTCHTQKARRDYNASGISLIKIDVPPTTVDENLSSDVVKRSKSSDGSKGFPKGSLHNKAPSFQKHKTETRISSPEPRGSDSHLQLHLHSISDPHLVSRFDVAIAEPMHRLKKNEAREGRMNRPSKSKTRLELRKNVSNRHRVGHDVNKIGRRSKSRSHSNSVHHHVKGDIEPREASAKVPRGQTSNEKLHTARVKSDENKVPKSNNNAIEAYTGKPNHQKSQFHESVLTKTAEYLLEGLESADTKEEQKYQKSTLINEHDCSSKARMTLRSNTSTRKSSRPRDSYKFSDVTSKKKRRSPKPDPPTRTELRNKKCRKPTTEKLSSFKSSLRSSLKGRKLSRAATSTLECDVVTDDDAEKQDKKRKARSMKSSHSVRASELSSSNLRGKSSSCNLNRDSKFKSKHRRSKKMESTL